MKKALAFFTCLAFFLTLVLGDVAAAQRPINLPKIKIHKRSICCPKGPCCKLNISKKLRPPCCKYRRRHRRHHKAIQEEPPANQGTPSEGPTPYLK